MLCLCVLSLPVSLFLVESDFSEVFSHKTQARLWFRACSCFFPSLFLSFRLSTFLRWVKFHSQLLCECFWSSSDDLSLRRGGIRPMEGDVTSYKHTHTVHAQRKHACFLRGIDGGDRDISSQAVVVLEKTK